MAFSIPLVGAHMSISGGAHNALYSGQSIGATVIQIFTANQRQWKTHLFSSEEIALWQEALEATHITHVMSHDSYLINIGSPDPLTLEKSQKALEQEIQRCHQLKIPYLNIHPGAALASDSETCLKTIINTLIGFAPLLEQGDTRILLETMAGQGSTMGHSFEELQYIIDRVHTKIPIGVCIDTCHIFAAGYDIRTLEGWENTLQKFNSSIGLKYLYAFHVNDSEKELGSRKDRHASLGKGKIGMESFKILMTHPKTKNLPKYLETPETESWVNEIKLLKNFATQK